jgi:hypothetical protein
MKNDNIFNNLLECINSINKAQEKMNNALKTDFIQALKSVGKHNAAKEVDEKGLPTYIAVSSDIYPVCLQIMTKYTKVLEYKLIDTKCTIMLIWNEFNIYSLYKI